MWFITPLTADCKENTLDTCAQKEDWNACYIASFSKYCYGFDKIVTVLTNLA